MPFVANKDIKIEASQREDGTFTLRTKGLDARRRAELEIAGVPEPALRAAGAVLNDVAEYSVNRAEVLPDQNVGFVLAGADGDEEDTLMLAVRTTAVVSPSGGLWSKITGGGKGVMRLLDVTGEPGPPLTALATMLVHRARVRLAKDDDAGAREELEAAIATFPGKPRAGAPVSIGDGSAVYNWQNHLAYLGLAELGGDDAEARYAEALERSDALAREEIGAPLADLASLDVARLEREARAIVETNREVMRQEGPSPDAVLVASPVWETLANGGGRRASLVPASFVARYLERPLPDAAIRIAAEAVATLPTASLAWTVRKTRDIWISDEAPFMLELDDYAPSQSLLSAVLADIARCASSGATDDAIAKRLRGEPLAKLADLESWEADAYARAMRL